MSETATRRPKQSKVDPNESREDKFIRLAKSRSKKLLHQMELLSNLGSSYAYKINADLAEELIAEFDDALQALRLQWRDKISGTRSRVAATATSDEEASDEDVSDDEDETSDEEAEETVSATA